MATLTKNHLLSLCLASMATSPIFADEAPDYIQGHIGALSNQLNRDIGDVAGNRYNTDTRFTYFNHDPSVLEKKFDASLLVNDQRLIIYSIQEAYLAKKGVFSDYNETTKVGDTLRFGRHNLTWSQMDAFWGLGKLNNRKNFDFFDPGQEGLIGVSYEVKYWNGVFWKFFASGVYVPESNPGLDINKGSKTITTRNQWANPPARTTEIEGNDTPIRYDVDYPQIDEVIWRYSVGAEFGFETKYITANGFYMRKPENQISTQVEVSLADDSKSINAFVKPQFYYHDVFGGSVKYQNRGFEAYWSGIGIFPNTFPDGEKIATTYTELKTEKRREAYIGWGASYTKDVYTTGLNYIARVSPFDRDADSLATDPRWNQAINAHLSRTIKTKFKLMGDIKYDMLTTDRLVMLRASYSASKSLLMTLGVNMIGTPNSGKSFWSPYTNNDALFASLRYVY